MKRFSMLLLFILGCSTAPIADTLDHFKPGKIEQGKVAPYGGVCGPQQASVPVAVAVPPVGVPALPGPAAGPVLPNPALPTSPLPPPDFGPAVPGR